MRDDMLVVGMADLNVTSAPGALTTIGLGSCVGIALYDAARKVAGLAHVMLPSSKLIQNNGNLAKFADTAVEKMVADMQRAGAKLECLRAKLAGGAQMFAFNSTNEAMRIGDRNVESAMRVLGAFGIPVVACDTGESYGRTVELYACDGRFVIRTVGHGEKVL